MMAAATWAVDATKILTRSEVATVIADLKRPSRRRSINSCQNLVVFRLATCCGLRAGEIAGLKLSNVKVGIERPYILVPKSIGKGGRQRRVPLWWDRSTLEDITAWKAERLQQGAGGAGFFICAQSAEAHGHQLERQRIRERFLVACRALGDDRLETLTVHHGRHSFVSHALQGGRSLAEVRDAAGHSNISTTSVYAHIASEDDAQVGDLFAFGQD